MNYSILIILLALILTGSTPDTNEYQSHVITISTDSANFELGQICDQQNLPLFYYRDIDQYPCDDSVCKRMQLRIYWDLWGNFLKLSFSENQELTKINHVPFSRKDYKQLHKLLNNPDAFIQYYQLDELTSKESENTYYSIDAISGATTAISEVTYESVRGAVKTCYTLWKIVHGETVNRIRSITIECFSSMNKDSTDSIQQTNRLIQMIKTTEEPSERFLKSVMHNFGNRPLIGRLCLLELARKSNGINKKFYKELSPQISDDHKLIDYAIYNYLLQMNYKDKIIRNFNLQKDDCSS